MCRIEDGALVGFFHVSEIIRGKLSSAFLGYGGIVEFAGQPGNRASIALAERAGVVKEASPSATSRWAAADATTSAGDPGRAVAR